MILPYVLHTHWMVVVGFIYLWLGARQGLAALARKSLQDLRRSTVLPSLRSGIELTEHPLLQGLLKLAQTVQRTLLDSVPPCVEAVKDGLRSIQTHAQVRIPGSRSVPNHCHPLLCFLVLIYTKGTGLKPGQCGQGYRCHSRGV